MAILNRRSVAIIPKVHIVMVCFTYRKTPYNITRGWGKIR
jgi:hypothetical protein